MPRKPLVAVSMGDPAGIGPEIIIKACTDKKLRQVLDPLIIGDYRVLQRAAQRLNSTITLVSTATIPEQPIRTKLLPVLQLGGEEKPVTPGKWSVYTGRRSYQAVHLAIALALEKNVDAMVTAPICKQAWQAAGVRFPGHTELLAQACGVKDYAMMFVGGPFRLILATIHEPLAKVPALLSQALIKKMILLGSQELKSRFAIKKPKIAVAGLNPHAGEGGVFGKEEQRLLIPAINHFRSSRAMTVTGPYPPDTLFVEASTGAYDLVLCLYHDQGLIPFKMLALHSGVNVTAGLPIIRTSPDHGTAFAIAGKDQAHPGSMIAALETAAAMAGMAVKRQLTRPRLVKTR